MRWRQVGHLRGFLAAQPSRLPLRRRPPGAPGAPPNLLPRGQGWLPMGLGLVMSFTATDSGVETETHTLQRASGSGTATQTTVYGGTSSKLPDIEGG